MYGAGTTRFGVPEVPVLFVVGEAPPGRVTGFDEKSVPADGWPGWQSSGFCTLHL